MGALIPTTTPLWLQGTDRLAQTIQRPTYVEAKHTPPPPKYTHHDTTIAGALQTDF